MKRVFLLSLTLLCLRSFAQETPQIEAQEPQVQEVDYTPQIFGSVRAKFEESTESGDHRFNVRNSRLGVKGMTSEHMRYAMQIDFNNEGSVSILDSYVAYVAGNFELSLGQQQYHFNADLDRGPSSSLFSNRSFLSKYLTTYYTYDATSPTDCSVKTIGSRDIGALMSYKFPTKIPIQITGGLMNGSGANNPEWNENMNYVARATIGAKSGFQVAGSYYHGYTPYVQKIEMYGGELRYAGSNYLIEAAYAQRILEQELDGTQTITAAHVHGYRTFELPKNNAIEYLAPHLRWDMGSGIEFINQYDGMIDRYDANRITVALNIGFAKKWIGSEIRIAYEEYMVGTSHSDANINPLLQDKYTIEFIASF
ncbi:MAG: porin [Rikenellaceae bacterium]